MTLAIYPGKYDLLHNGHIWVIEEGAKRYDQVIAAVYEHPLDKTSYYFSLDERVAMLKEATKDYSNVTVEDLGRGFLLHYAASRKATHILRGIRSSADLDEEIKLRIRSQAIVPEVSVQWDYLENPPQHIALISSGFVKQLVGHEGWEDAVKKFVPPIVYIKLLERYHNR